MPNLLGTAPNQCPTNGDLGKLAFMDVVDTVTNNPYLDTAISDTKPSLLLDFANSKTLDPRITYTRASTATYFDPNGVMQTAAAGVPRFDHDPITGESKGFLIEEQRSNLVTDSATMSGSNWFNYGGITTNTAVSPDGTLNASLITNVTGSINQSYFTINLTAGTYTWSVFAKAATTDKIWLYEYGNLKTEYTLSGAGLIGAIPSGNAATITPVGNGWYRCTMTWAHSGGVAEINRLPTTVNSTAFFWGAQLEAGSFATSYIPTTSAQVTRSADAASITGANFSSWFNQAQGSLYIEAAPTVYPSYGFALFALTDGTANNYYAIQQVSNSLTAINARYSGGSSVNVTFANMVAGTSFKVASSYAPSSLASSLNGSAVVSNSGLPVLPTLNQASITTLGVSGWGASYSGTIKRIAYYPKRLSDAELQEMTL